MDQEAECHQEVQLGLNSDFEDWVDVTQDVGDGIEWTEVATQ